jgi:PmbA protein
MIRRLIKGVTLESATGTNGNSVPDDTELDLDMARKIITIAEKNGATGTEVFMIKGSGTDFSIEKDEVKFASSGTEFGMGIRVIKDSRVGFGYCTNPDHAERAIKDAVSTTKLRREIKFEFLTKALSNQIDSIFDSSILDISVTDGLNRAHELIKACKDFDNRVIVTGGGIGYGSNHVALVTSNGAELEYQATGIVAGVATLLKDKSVSTGSEFTYSRTNDIDYGDIGKIAAELAVSGQNPEKIESGKYSVVFTPQAISELFEFTVVPALYGEQALKGETFFSKKLNTQVAVPEVSFIDNGMLENGINTSPFDDEGSPTQKTVLVENGILKQFLFDRMSALEFDERSTGNAIRAEGLGGGRSYRAQPRTRVLNFMVTGEPKPRDELISEIKNGLLVYEMLGAHTANQASGDFSVNSPTLFKIKDGSIDAAGKQVMISGNMGQLIKQILNIGDDYKLLGGGLTPIAFNLPSIAIQDVKII